MTKRIAFTSICSLLAGTTLWAQTFQGGIRGTIADTSGATIAVAKVTLTDQSTGIVRSTVTSDGGEYSFSAVNPATYTVSVQRPGFKTLDRVLRFQRFFRLAARPEEKHNLADIADRAGYADQAHMTREVRRMSGITAGEFVAQAQGRLADSFKTAVAGHV